MDHKHFRHSLEMLWNDVERLRRMRNGPDQKTIDRLRADLVAIQNLLASDPPYPEATVNKFFLLITEAQTSINEYLFSRIEQ
jgi:hypothetical protein